jgi:hypothetical protein
MAASAPEVWVIDDDSSVSEQGNDDRTQQQVSNKGEEYAEVQHVLREIRNESGQILSQDEEQVPDGGEEEEGDDDDEDDEEDKDLIASDDIKDVLCEMSITLLKGSVYPRLRHFSSQSTGVNFFAFVFAKVFRKLDRLINLTSALKQRILIGSFSH